jgi:glutamate transport system substrate-binding protein
MSATLSRLTTLAVALSVTLVVVSAACAPTGPTVESYREKSPTLARADQDRVLRIGVLDKVPLMSELDPQTKQWKGFDIEIATQLAHEFGFTRPENIKFFPLTTDKRISALQAGDVHLVVADFSMTEQRCNVIRCAGPYLTTTPEIMIRTADQARIKTIDDLKKVKVCTTGGSTSAQLLDAAGVAHSLRSNGSECTDGVLNGTYDAQFTDSVVIAGRLQRNPGQLLMVDMPFDQTELLSVAVPQDDEWLQGLVAHYFTTQIELGSRSQWQAAYDANLYDALGPQTQPPLVFLGPGQAYPRLLDNGDFGR